MKMTFPKTVTILIAISTKILKTKAETIVKVAQTASEALKVTSIKTKKPLDSLEIIPKVYTTRDLKILPTIDQKTVSTEELRENLTQMSQLHAEVLDIKDLIDMTEDLMAVVSQKEIIENFLETAGAESHRETENLKERILLGTIKIDLGEIVKIPTILMQMDMTIDLRTVKVIKVTQTEDLAMKIQKI